MDEMDKMEKTFDDMFKHKAYSLPVDLSSKYEADLERLRLQQKMQQAKMEMEAAIEKKPSNEALIVRLMEMQKKLIDRLEIENARLTKELEKHVNVG